MVTKFLEGKIRMNHRSPLESFLDKSLSEGNDIDPGFIAYLASLEQINSNSPEVVKSIVQELDDQRSNLKMIASENFSSLAVQLAQGNLFTDKYAEGYPFHRFYAGCDNVDTVESNAVDLAKEIFGCEHAYMQPHSGADANLVAYWAILSSRVQNPYLNSVGKKDVSALDDSEWKELRTAFGNQRILGMDYYSGGHLTHGYRHNVSSRMFEAHSYSVDPKTKLIDYSNVRELAKRIRPLIILAGYSAYPRHINFRIFREIADEVGAVFMVDMAHFSGLVAGGLFVDDNDPVKHAHIVTSTTHKTLRGPRGGMILSTNELGEHVDKGCPLVLGGPLPHAIASKAVAFSEAKTKEFKEYTKNIVVNSKTLAKKFINLGVEVLTGGTDNHLMLIDVTPFKITGRQAESVLRDAGITLNRNSLPFDVNGPWYTSGLRIGTPAITTLGMAEAEMNEISEVSAMVLKNTIPETISKGRNAGNLSKAKYKIDQSVLNKAKSRIKDLLKSFPVYPEIDLDYLKEKFLKK